MLRFIVILQLVSVALARGNGPPLKRTYLTQKHIDRIVGGEETQNSEARPYQVSLILTDPSGSYLCGGSILNARWILTAAHCMDGIKTIDVRAGSNHLFSGGIVAKTFRYKVHPNFNSKTFDYDIAVVDLMANVLPLNNKTIKAVDLAAPGSSLETGTPVTVSGYGATSENGPTSEVLRQVTVNIVDRQTCKNAYSTFTSRMICAGVPGGGKDSCQGDSGGPLVTANNTQVGIVSFGIGCARSEYPGVYTNVGLACYRSWIKTNTGA